MILTCKECDTSFNFDERLVKPSGSKVRCSKCRSIFTVFPHSELQPAEALATAGGAAGTSAAAGLDDVDVDEIVSSLELEPDALESVEPGTDDAASAETDLKFDLDFDEEEPPVATKPGIEFEETQELDLSDLDLDESAQSKESAAAEEEDELSFDLDLDEGDAPSESLEKGAAGETPVAGAADELDFKLDLDLDETSEAATGTDETAATSPAEELDFDLDLGLDEEPAKTTEAEATDAKEDLDFDLDFDLEEDKTSSDVETPAVEDELDFSLDLDLDEEKTTEASADALDFDETQELGLSGAEDLAELDVADASASAVEDELDFNLDLDSDQVGGDDLDLAEVTETEDALDFDLDLEAVGEEDQPEELSETAAAAEDVGAESLDFDLDSALAPEEEDFAAGAMEETEELDLTGLEDALEIEEKGGTPESGSDADDALDLDLDLEETAGEAAPEEGEYDLSDLDMALDSDQETQMLAPEESGGADDFGIELDLDEASADEAMSEEDEDVEFDLSDLDDMLEIEEGAEAEPPVAESQDFDLELDMGGDAVTAAGAGDMQAAADVELDFEEDDDGAAYPADAAEPQGDNRGDGFDMGSLSELDEGLESEDSDAYLAGDAATPSPKKPKAPRKKMGGFFKFLLVLLLLGGGGYAGYSLTKFFGIEIPYLDQLKSIRIPYVSDFLGQPPADPGNLQLSVVERDLNGRFVKNVKLGNLYVISGNVQNNYGHPRSFITINGKLYVKGRKLFSEHTVYAGNTLSDEELTRFDQAAVDKFFKNRFGQKRSNINLKKGATVPFMIVFSGLPDNLDEYTVEPAGSVKARK